MTAMNTYIALLRGINIGGKNKLPMKALTLLLEQERCVDVKTYIQSGNVIFRSRLSNPGPLAKRLSAAVARNHGFAPRVLMLGVDELERAAAGNPFPEADENPKSLHLFFLDDKPEAPDWKAFEAVATMNERFELKDRVFYLYTPDGFGISKLSARAENLLGVAATARN